MDLILRVQQSLYFTLINFHNFLPCKVNVKVVNIIQEILAMDSEIKGKLRFAKKKKIYYLNSKSGVRNCLKIQKKHFYHISSL